MTATLPSGNDAKTPGEFNDVDIAACGAQTFDDTAIKKITAGELIERPRQQKRQCH
jgi:hypothetical protein